jgi:hypothetical protein
MTSSWACSRYLVIPAKAGIHLSHCAVPADIHGTAKWIPAFAGMTEVVM